MWKKTIDRWSRDIEDQYELHGDFYLVGFSLKCTAVILDGYFLEQDGH